MMDKAYGLGWGQFEMEWGCWMMCEREREGGRGAVNNLSVFLYWFVILMSTHYQIYLINADSYPKKKLITLSEKITVMRLVLFFSNLRLIILPNRRQAFRMAN